MLEPIIIDLHERSDTIVKKAPFSVIWCQTANVKCIGTYVKWNLSFWHSYSPVASTDEHQKAAKVYVRRFLLIKVC